MQVEDSCSHGKNIRNLSINVCFVYGVSEIISIIHFYKISEVFQLN